MSAPFAKTATSDATPEASINRKRPRDDDDEVRGDGPSSTEAKRVKANWASWPTKKLAKPIVVPGHLFEWNLVVFDKMKVSKTSNKYCALSYRTPMGIANKFYVQLRGDMIYGPQARYNEQGKKFECGLKLEAQTDDALRRFYEEGNATIMAFAEENNVMFRQQDRGRLSELYKPLEKPSWNKWIQDDFGNYVPDVNKGCRPHTLKLDIPLKEVSLPDGTVDHVPASLLILDPDQQPLTFSELGEQKRCEVSALVSVGFMWLSVTGYGVKPRVTKLQLLSLSSDADVSLLTDDQIERAGRGELYDSGANMIKTQEEEWADAQALRARKEALMAADALACGGGKGVAKCEEVKDEEANVHDDDDEGPPLETPDDYLQGFGK